MSVGFLALAGAVGVGQLAVSFGLGPESKAQPVVSLYQNKGGGFAYRNWQEYEDAILGRIRKGATLGNNSNETVVNVDDWLSRELERLSKEEESEIVNNQTIRKIDNWVNNELERFQKSIWTRSRSEVPIWIDRQVKVQSDGMNKTILLAYIAYQITRYPILPGNVILALIGIRMYNREER